MTVSSIVPVNNHYGNNSTKVFDFDFLIESNQELVVTHITSKGISSVLTEGVDYSINEIGNENGSYINFPLEQSSYNILGTDEILSLSLNLEIKQESKFENSSYLNLKVLEWTFDYIVRLIQMIARKVDRSVKVREGDEVTPDALLNSLNEAQNEAYLASQTAIQKATAAEEAAADAIAAANTAVTTLADKPSKSEVVTITGTQNISGIKTFTNNCYINKPGSTSGGYLILMSDSSGTYAETTAPSAIKYFGKIQFCDVNKNYVSYLQTFRDVSNNYCCYLGLRRDINGTAYTTSMGLDITSSGEKRCFLNGNKVVATVSEIGSNYIVFSNGFKIQFGLFDYGSVAHTFSGTVTLPKAMTSTNYSVSVNAMASNPTQGGFDTRTTTTFKIYSTRDSGTATAQLLSWIVAGF